MAELTVDGLGELTSPAANDEIGIWDVSAGQYLKIRRDTLVGGTITGDGTVATGGYTLTVPATGTAVLLATTQTLTGAKTFDDVTVSNKLKFPMAGGSLQSGIAGRSIVSVEDGGLVNLATLFATATINGILFVHNANIAVFAIFQLRAGLNTVTEALDPSSDFSATAGTAGTNIIYSGGYYLENKTGYTCSYHCWVLQ